MHYKTLKKNIDMKTILFLLAILIAPSLHAQTTTVFLPDNHTLHFISPEPIQYVDISSKSLEGDLPLKNVCRIKLRDTSGKFKDAVITIAGEKFIAQYHLFPGNNLSPTEINILPADTRPLDIAGIGLSQNQLYKLSLDLFARKPDKLAEKVKSFGVEGRLNHVYTVGDYLFLDISYRNRTNLSYAIEDFTFKVDDKKVNKASNVQSVELKPEYVLFPVPSFSKYYRNIFVIRKLTFPGNKVLRVELREKQLSGRVVTLGISYQDVLNADTLPL
jgi:conjugative transposon TraN protein